MFDVLPDKDDTLQLKLTITMSKIGYVWRKLKFSESYLWIYAINFQSKCTVIIGLKVGL